MFWAEKGVGAYLNDRRIRVSARRDMLESLFATGIPFAKVSPKRRLPFARVMGTLMPQVAGIRRFGAAALDRSCGCSMKRHTLILISSRCPTSTCIFRSLRLLTARWPGKT